MALIDGAVVGIEAPLENVDAFGTYDLLVGRTTSARHRDGGPALTLCEGHFGTDVPKKDVDA